MWMPCGSADVSNAFVFHRCTWSWGDNVACVTCKGAVQGVMTIFCYCRCTCYIGIAKIFYGEWTVGGGNNGGGRSRPVTELQKRSTFLFREYSYHKHTCKHSLLMSTVFRGKHLHLFHAFICGVSLSHVIADHAWMGETVEFCTQVRIAKFVKPGRIKILKGLSTSPKNFSDCGENEKLVCHIGGNKHAFAP